MAPKESLACSRVLGEDHTSAQISSSSLEMVASRRQCGSWLTFAVPSIPSATDYRCIIQRLGHTLRGLHCKRPLVKARKQLAHIFSGAERGPTGLQEVQALLLGLDNSSCDRQQLCCT